MFHITIFCQTFDLFDIFKGHIFLFIQLFFLETNARNHPLLSNLALASLTLHMQLELYDKAITNYIKLFTHKQIQMKRKILRPGTHKQRSDFPKNNQLPKYQDFTSQSFHLKQPEQAENAKNDLFFQAQNIDVPRDRKAFNKTYHQFHKSQYFDSWHGQSLNQSINRDNASGKIIQNPQKQEKIAQKKQMLIERQRQFLHSAMELKDNKIKIAQMKKSLKGLYQFIPTNKKILTLSPASNNIVDKSIKNDISLIQKRRRPIKSAYISLRTSKQFVSLSNSLPKNQTCKSSSINCQEIKKVKNISIDPHEVSVSLGAKINKKGMFGSVVRNKKQNKGKWIELKTKISNISRVYQVSNETIKGDIGRIIDLINEEDRIEKNESIFK